MASTKKKNPALDAKHKAILKKMMQLPENRKCADCWAPSPRWASTNLGVFLCIACSGIHRKLGVHITTVRSTSLDVWTVEQIAHFQALGNAKAAEIYEPHLPSNFRRPSSSDSISMERFIRDKYERRIYANPQHGATSAPNPTSSATSFNSVQTPAAARAQAYVASNPRNQSLGPRPSIYEMLPPRNAYDSHGSNLNSQSFANTFRSAPHNGATQNVPSNLSPVASSLIEMGFPREVAIEASQRYGNNLQQAADWVLRQKSVRLYSAPAPKRSPPRQAPIENLMDLSDTQSTAPVPTRASVAKSAPKAFGTESLLFAQPQKATQHQAPVSSVNVEDEDDDDDDFTDFTSFASALPATNLISKTTNPNPPTSISVNGSSSIHATLAGLYAQESTKSPKGVTMQTAAPLSPIRPLSSVSPLAAPAANPANTNESVGMSSKPPFTSIADKKVDTEPEPQPVKSTEISIQKAPVTEEDEDPFAALALQALSAASMKKKPVNGTQAKSAGDGLFTSNLVGSENKKAEGIDGGTTSSGLNLDDLLGL